MVSLHSTNKAKAAHGASVCQVEQSGLYHGRQIARMTASPASGATPPILMPVGSTNVGYHKTTQRSSYKTAGHNQSICGRASNTPARQLVDGICEYEATIAAGGTYLSPGCRLAGPTGHQVMTQSAGRSGVCYFESRCHTCKPIAAVASGGVDPLSPSTAAR